MSPHVLKKGQSLTPFELLFVVAILMVAFIVLITWTSSVNQAQQDKIDVVSNSLGSSAVLTSLLASKQAERTIADMIRSDSRETKVAVDKYLNSTYRSSFAYRFLINGKEITRSARGIQTVRRAALPLATLSGDLVNVTLEYEP